MKYNVGNFRFSKMNLRTKTLLTISFTVIFLAIILLSSLLIEPTSIKTNFNGINLFPSFEHLFGTDWMGRDMFTRTLKGLGLSIQIGLFASLLSGAISVVLGLLSGINKYCDTFVSWLIDLVASIPHLLLIMLISIALGGGTVGVIVGVAFTHWTSNARILRAEIKQIKTSEFVKLSEKFGRSKLWITTKHFLPLIVSQIVLGIILIFPHAIMHEASITFLGFGLSPHEPAIGIILSEAMNYLSTGAWWLAFFPGFSLLIIVLLFDLIGDSLQMLLNPSSANE